MDLLFKRYASPFIMLDGIIECCQLSDFLEVLIEKREEEELWELYLHKLGAFDDRTFEEFKNNVNSGRPKKVEKPDDRQIEATIQDSFNILSNFKIEVG